MAPSHLKHVRGTQNKPMIRHHCIPPRMANMGNANRIQCWWSWGWTGICGHFVGIHGDQQLFGELWNTYLPSEMPVSFLHVYFRELKKNVSTKKTHVRIYITTLLSITPVWKWLGMPVSRRMSELSLMQSHRGTLLRNKRSFWNTMHRVPDSVTFSAVTELCTVADCGLRVGGRKWAGKVWGSILTLVFLGFASDAPSPREDLSSRQTVFVCYPRRPSVFLPQWIIVCLVESYPEVQIV